MADSQIDAGADFLGESRFDGVNLILSYWERRRLITPGAIGNGIAHRAGLDVLDRDIRAGDHSAGRIVYRSGKSRGGLGKNWQNKGN